jgi:hypothetical protein
MTKQLLNSVKTTSVDCDLYDNSKEGLVCYNYGFATTNEFSSFPAYKEDKEVREGTDMKATNANIVRVYIQETAYAHNPITNELYDYAKYMGKPQVKFVVGHLGKDTNGQNMMLT